MAAHGGPIDLLVTDIVMPGLGGPALAARLVADRPALRVLFITGYAPEAVERRGDLADGGGLLEKPFTARPARAKGAGGARARSTLRLARLPPRAGVTFPPHAPSQPAVTPPGALDLTGEAARRRRQLQRAAMEVLERAGYEELIPPTLEYQDTFLRAGGAGRRRAADPLPRPRRPHPRAPLRFHRQPRAGGRDDVRRAPAGRCGCATRAPSTGRSPSAAAARARCCRSVPSCWARATSPPTSRSCGSRSRSSARPDSQDFQVNLGHVGVLAPGLAALADELRAPTCAAGSTARIAAA